MSAIGKVSRWPSLKVMTIEDGSFAAGSLCGAGRALRPAARTSVPRKQACWAMVTTSFSFSGGGLLSTMDAKRGSVDVNSENGVEVKQFRLTNQCNPKSETEVECHLCAAQSGIRR